MTGEAAERRAGSLHEISVAIGELQAEARNAERSRALTREEILRMSGRVDVLADRMEAMARETRDAVAEIRALALAQDRMRPHVEDYSRLKQRALGFLTGLFLLAGGTGAGAYAAAQRFLSGSPQP